jgi:hypothetical protein
VRGSLPESLGFCISMYLLDPLALQPSSFVSHSAGAECIFYIYFIYQVNHTISINKSIRITPLNLGMSFCLLWPRKSYWHDGMIFKDRSQYWPAPTWLYLSGIMPLEFWGPT